MKRSLWLGFVVSLYLICTGCGDTFRPIIIPNPPVFPNPKAAHTVVSINDNAPPAGQQEFVAGTAMVVDVSGDTDESVANVGLAPVFAVQQTASQVLVANHSVTGAVGDSITKLSFNSVIISSTATISLPPNSAPNFVTAAPTDTIAYVTLPDYLDPTTSTIIPSVGVVNTLSNTLSNTPTPVGVNPVALAVTPDKTKLYVANQGDSTISSFNAFNAGSLSVRGVSPPNTSSPPIWLVARNDSQRVYVLETNGVLASIDTTASAGPDPLTEYPALNVPGANTMVYDNNLNRLYIPGGNQLAIVDVSGSVPALLESISIPQVPNLPNPVSASAVAVAALPDGTRAYVASVPAAAQPSQVNISSVQGDGTTATFGYTWTVGHDLTLGISVVVSGLAMPNDVFNGTYVITATSGTACYQAASGCTFQALSPNILLAPATVAGVASSTIDSLFPQVTVIDVASGTTVTPSIGLPGFPDATVVGSPYYVPICATTRFRYNMAAGGDSSRVYLSSCDGGAVDIIDTTTNAYILNLPAPVGIRPPISPDPQNPPQNPIFLFAGP